MRDRTFIVAVSAVVCIVLMGYAYVGLTGGPSGRINFGLGGGEPNELPKQVAAVVKSPRLRSWLSAAPQARITDAMRKNLFGFDQMILGVAEAITSSNRTFYATFLPDQYLIPVGMEVGDAFTTSGGERLIQVKLTRADPRPMLEEIASARSLAAMYPAVNFSYYLVTPFQMTRQALSLGYVDPAIEYGDRFAAGLSGVADVGSLQLDDWAGGFYKTDHHWNPRGAYQGYLDIMELLGRSRPGIGEARVPFAQKTLAGVDFRGSESRMAAVRAWSEPMDVLEIDLPALSSEINGRPVDAAAAHRKYASAPPDGLYSSHYGGYYGRDVAMRTFTRSGAKESDGNLLVFADSYGDSMLPLVATHFSHTFHVDLRHWEDEYGEPFDMASFVKEHGITDVLAMGRPLRVLQTPGAVLAKGRLL